MTGDDGAKDHRIRLNDEEMAYLSECMGFAEDEVKRKNEKAPQNGRIAWQLRQRLTRLGSARRW